MEIFHPPDNKTRNNSNPNNNNYSPDVAFSVKVVYVIAILLWIVVIAWLGLYKGDTVAWLFICIPFVLFIFAMINSDSITIETEDLVFQSNYLTVGLLIVIPLLTWMNRDYKGNDKDKFVSLLVAMVVFILLSMLDIWVKKEYISVIRHIKSVLETFAVVILIYAFYTYYVEYPHSILK